MGRFYEADKVRKPANVCDSSFREEKQLNVIHSFLDVRCVVVLFPFINLHQKNAMRTNIFFKSAIFAVAVAFTACDPNSDENLQVVTFDDAQLSEMGYWNGSDKKGVGSLQIHYWGTDSLYLGYYQSEGLSFENRYFYNFEGSYDYWNGFAVSGKHNMDSVGYLNQYSVYAPTGANGSNQFGLVYISNAAVCVFDRLADVKSLMINNSTYVYQAVKNGRDGNQNNTQFQTGDYMLATIVGYDANNQKKDSIDVVLADFRGNLQYVCENWKSVNLEPLGSVKKLEFKFFSTNKNVPSYYCIDNVAFSRD